MPTIQIADKPTLDSVNDMLDAISINNVHGRFYVDAFDSRVAVIEDWTCPDGVYFLNVTMLNAGGGGGGAAGVCNGTPGGGGGGGGCGYRYSFIVPVRPGKVYRLTAGYGGAGGSAGASTAAGIKSGDGFSGSSGYETSFVCLDSVKEFDNIILPGAPLGTGGGGTLNGGRGTGGTSATPNLFFNPPNGVVLTEMKASYIKYNGAYDAVSHLARVPYGVVVGANFTRKGGKGGNTDLGVPGSGKNGEGGAITIRW